MEPATQVPALLTLLQAERAFTRLLGMDLWAALLLYTGDCSGACVLLQRCRPSDSAKLPVHAPSLR